QIDCIGFSRSDSDAMVVPFVDRRKPGFSFWAHQGDEVTAWGMIRRALASPIAKIFQNGLYDLQYIWGKMGFIVNNCKEDTMLLPHAIFPEMPKGIGFLGSIYTNEASWKMMREDDTTKRDE